MENTCETDTKMNKSDREHFDKQFLQIKTTYEEVKLSYKIFNDDFLEAVQKVIEDQLNAHKDSDKKAILEFIKKNHTRLTRIEERIFSIEQKLGIS